MEIDGGVGSLGVRGKVIARELQFLVVIPKLLELVKLMVAKLARGKQESALQNTQALGDRNRVKILDLETPDFAGWVPLAVLHHIQGNLEQIPVVGLEEEEEGTGAALEFVHHARHNHAFPLRVLGGTAPPGYGN